MRHYGVGPNRHTNVWWRCMGVSTAVAAAAWWGAAVLLLLLLLVPAVRSELYNRYPFVGHYNQQRMQQPDGHDRWHPFQRRNLNDNHALWELTPRGGASFDEYSAAVPVPVPSSTDAASRHEPDAVEDDEVDVENDTAINAKEYSYNDDEVDEDDMIENNRNLASIEEEAHAMEQEDDDDGADFEWVEEEDESTTPRAASVDILNDDDAATPPQVSTESGKVPTDHTYNVASWDEGEEENDEDDIDVADSVDSVDDDNDESARNIQIEMTGVGSESDDNGSFFSGDAMAAEDADSAHSSQNQGGDDDPEGGDDDDDDGSHSDEASAASFTTQVLLDNPAIDENDSASYVDRLDLADDYDNEDVVAASLDLADSDGASAAAVAGSDDELPAVSTPAPTESTNSSDDIVEDTILAPEVVMTTSSLTTEDDTPSELAHSIATFTDHHSSGLTEIDDETRHVLTKELNYRRQEIDAMKTDVAVLVAANKLHRPEEGIPTNWRKAANETKRQQPGWLASLRQQPAFKLLSKVAGIAIVGSLAVIKGPDIASGLLKSTAPQHKRFVVSGKMSPTAKATATLTPPDATDDYEVLDPFAEPDAQGTVTEPTASDIVPAKKGGGSGGLMESQHTKSVKPGAGRPNNDDLDVTWLDKLITAVERRIKAFLQLEI